MKVQYVFDAEEIEQLLPSDAELESMTTRLEAVAGRESVTATLEDVRDVINRALPILKTAEKVICTIPFTRKWCDSLRTAVNLLETVART